MPKKIVICCDGTGNQIEQSQSNVLKLYRILKDDRRQLSYYHPGIGTMGANNGWDIFKQKIRSVFGLITGAGIDKHVLHAYDFLARNYAKGDELYFFGFSRGAYTIRVLAGFINAIGLLKPEQLHLTPYALAAFKNMKSDERTTETMLFEQALKVNFPTIRFMGLWDTVSSILVPRSDRILSIPSFQHLAFTQENSMIEKVRHAISIDERRRMFRPYLWTDEGEYRTNPYNAAGARVQDIEQRWFAGVHSDVGGSYDEVDSGLSKYSLSWMLDEVGPGLLINKQTRNQIAKGHQRANSSWQYSKPAPDAKMHNSLTAGWWLVEIWPKKTKHRERSKRWNILGLYFPLGEPRTIPDSHSIDPSVRQRQAVVPDYQPINLREKD